MSKNALKPVPARVVREFAREGRITITDAALDCVLGGPQGRGRGRLNRDLIAAFNAENGEGLVYAGEKSEAEVKTVEVPMFSPKTGRPVKALVKPLSEVREAAGVKGKRGRLSAADLHAAALVFGSGEPKVKAEPKAAKPAAKGKGKA